MSQIDKESPLAPNPSHPHQIITVEYTVDQKTHAFESCDHEW